MTTIDLSAIENDVNLAEDIASKLSPFLMFIPGIGPYVGAITAAIPEIVKATKAIEQVAGVPVGSPESAQAVADHINPEKPSNPVLAGQ